MAGHDVLAEPDAVRRAIGVVAQRSGVDREATGRENLRLQGQVYGLRGRDLENRVDELLERFGLAEAADRVGRGYSGGMARRLDIAMALIHRPNVLFLDEPTTGLDPEVRADMWREIEGLATDQGITDPAHDALPRGGRPAGGPAGDRRSRQGRRHRRPRGAQGRPAWRRRVVELDGQHNGNVSRALQRVEGLREISVEGRALRARADNGARAVPHVLQALDAARRAVASVTVARPSLDDVYLRYAGRTFVRPTTKPTRRRRASDECRTRLRARLA